MITRTVTGEMACAQAARSAGHGYQGTFPPGRDPAVLAAKVPYARPGRTQDSLQAASLSPAPAGPVRPPRAFLDLGTVLTAPGCARAWTRQILREWSLAGLTDTADIVVSELVTNAVEASRALGRPVVRLILSFGRGQLSILVRDDHPGAPRPQQPDADDESGRGLLLTQALSDRFGWYRLEQGGPGKVVWSVLKAPPVAPGASQPALCP